MKIFTFFKLIGSLQNFRLKMQIFQEKIITFRREPNWSCPVRFEPSPSKVVNFMIYIVSSRILSSLRGVGGGGQH